MAVTRNDGYRLGRGKEEAGLTCASRSLARLLGLNADSITRIDGADDNYPLGDVRLPNRLTVEVKRQPINRLQSALCGYSIEVAGTFTFTTDLQRAVFAESVVHSLLASPTLASTPDGLTLLPFSDVAVVSQSLPVGHLYAFAHTDDMMTARSVVNDARDGSANPADITARLKTLLASGSPVLFRDSGWADLNTFITHDSEAFQADIANAADLPVCARLGGYQSVEVKNDMGTRKTGNIYIEYEQIDKRNGGYKPSGISTTQADLWVQFIGDIGHTMLMLCMPTHELRERVTAPGVRTADTFGDNPSRGYIPRLADLLTCAEPAPVV